MKRLAFIFLSDFDHRSTPLILIICYEKKVLFWYNEHDEESDAAWSHLFFNPVLNLQANEENFHYEKRGTTMTVKEIEAKLLPLTDESLGKTLEETEGIKHIGIDSDKLTVVLIIALGEIGGDAEKNIKRQIAKIVKLDLGFDGVRIQFEEHKTFDAITKKNVTFIGIISGKGGVGKSTVAANIAYRLSKKGKKVGLIDADIYGSSIPNMLEIEHANPRMNQNKKIIPMFFGDIEVISTEFFTNPSQPVIWRGAMLNKMMNHFFYDVAWDPTLDFIIIDLPPGTGDIALDLKSIVPKSKMLLVTTPHPSASHVAIKAGFAARELKHELIGVVENMSFYENPINKQPEFLFGKGGGEAVSTKLETELLAKIPINQPLHHTSLYELDETAGKIYDSLADYMIYQLK